MANTLSDVEVVLDVYKAATPVNLGTLAIFTPGAANGLKAYTTLEDLQADVTDADVLQVASGYFAQSTHAKEIDIVNFSDMTSALDEYYSAGWEFATVAGAAATPEATEGNPNPVAPTNDAAIMALSNYIEGKSARFVLIGLPGTPETVTNAEQKKQTYFGNERTVLFVSGDDQSGAEYGIGALVGALGNETVGSITWKFKSLIGVKPVDYTASQVGKLHDNGMFTYVTKAGTAQTSEGITVSGEFIDALHGDDWIKDNIVSSLQQMLQTTPKLPFDAAGIAQIDATVTSVLMQATENGIVLVNADTNAGDYTVTTVSRADTPAEDIAARHYDGLSFVYTRSGAIHSITVHGTVSL